MRLGIPKDTSPGETRVALVPDAVAKLIKAGHTVAVERGAGAAAGHGDQAYEEKGAQLVDAEGALGCDAVLAVQPPDPARLAKNCVLVGLLDPLGRPDRVRALAERGVTSFALELMPRISRAQAMDVLSSMAGIGGYKAVLLAAARLPKMFPLMMTAAGTVRPAKVFVLGVGVAGLQAIATARRLGAIVEAYDIRPATRQEVESLGARFVEFDIGAGDAQDAGGYAKELTDAQKTRQAELMAAKIQEMDVVITTAQVPGRKAPVLVPGKVVEGMRAGSVIVDMAAAETGGNCELTECGKETVKHGVTIIGFGNLPATVPGTASQLYANNMVHFINQLTKDGQMVLNLDDEVLRAPLVTHEGKVTNERVAGALSA